MVQRIQLSRRRGWRKPPGAIVVARPSRWGNPYSVATYGRLLVVRLFGRSVRGQWDPQLLEGADDAKVNATRALHEEFCRRFGERPISVAIAELAGHDLACWCAPNTICHADVLLAVSNPHQAFASSIKKAQANPQSARAQKA